MIAARLQAYTPNGAPLGEMPYPLTIDPMVAHNDVGSLAFSYSNLAAGGAHLATALQSGLEVALELSKGEKDSLGRDVWVEPKGCRFVRLEDDGDPSDPTKRVGLTLPGFGWLLSKCVVGAAGAIEGRRVFTAPTVGSILLTLLDENVDRDGYATSIAPTFTATTDSAGVAWPVLEDQTFEIGVDYLTVLDGLTAAGGCDWTTQARGLYCYTPDSVTLSPDLSGTGGVVLSLGTDVAGAPTKRSIANMAGRVMVLAEAGGVTMAEEPTAFTGWGIPESTLRIGQVSGESAAIAVGQAELERIGRPQGQYTRELILAAPKRVPLLDYWPGCWIMAPGAEGVGERLRVQQGTLSFQGVKSTGSLTLNDVLLESDERRARTLASLAGGIISPGGPAAPIAVDPEASRIPSTPTGLDSTAVVVFQGPTPRGVVTATWNAVTTATDSGPLTISGYEPQWRIGSGDWQTIFTPEVSAQIGNLTPGDTVETRVRAVGARTTLPSAWSATDTVVVPGDVTPPPVPTVPTADGAMTVISVTWDGSLEDAIPADFARVEVALGDTDTPTTVRGTLTRTGTVQIEGEPIGAERWTRLRSVDTTGNESDWTAAVPVSAQSVVAADIDAAIKAAIAEGEDAWTTAQRLLLTSVDNICDDPSFATFGTPLTRWGVTSANRMPDPTGGRQGGPALKVIANGALQTTTGGNAWVKSAPGGAYRVGCWVYSDVAIPVNGAYVWVQGRNATGDGTHVADLFTPEIPAATWTWIQSPPGVSAPETVEIRTVVQIRPEMASGTVWIDGVTVTRAADASLVVDGAITTIKLAADAVEAGNIAVGALDFKAAQGMSLVAPDIKTAVSGGRLEIAPTGLVGYAPSGTQTLKFDAATGNVSIIGNLSAVSPSGSVFAGTAGTIPGFWVGDGTRDRATMQVSGGTAPGFYTWDSAGTVRMSLFTNGTTSTMSFKNSGGVEVLKINDSIIQHRYTSGRLSLEESQGTLLVYADLTTAPDIFRTYWDSAASAKRVYIGHQSSPVKNFNVWGDDVSVQSTSGEGGLVSISTRGTTGVQITSYDGTGTILRGYAKFDIGGMFLGQYTAAGDLAARVNLVAADTFLQAGSSSGNQWFEAGSSTGVIQFVFGGTTASDSRRMEFVDGSNSMIAEMNRNGFRLHRNSGVTSGDNVVRRSSDGHIGWASSSARFKQDIEDHQVNLDALRALRVRSWRDRAEVAEVPDTTNRYVGAVAEEVHDLGLTEMVSYEADGTPRNLVDRAWLAGLTQWLQHLDARMTAVDGGASPAKAIRAVATVAETRNAIAVPEPRTVTPPTRRPTSAPVSDPTPHPPPDPAAPDTPDTTPAEPPLQRGDPDE